MSRSRAWAPLLVPIALILLGGLQERTRILADPGIALLLGAMLCLALERKKMQELIHVASRRSGVILLDLCGAGAFGYVVAQSGLSQEIFRLGHFLPALLLPFLVSAALQLAQGSRVVTATVCRSDPGRLSSAGSNFSPAHRVRSFHVLLCHRSLLLADQKLHRGEHEETVLGYTLPLSLLGLAAFALAAISSIL